MGKRIDLTGQRFGRLVVEGFAHTDKYKRAMWNCKCDCGKRITTLGVSLRRGETKSCGCLHREMAAKSIKEQSITHGKSYTRLYSIWHGMISRIENENQMYFKNYGGRGIQICDEWREDFQKFYDWAVRHGYEEHLTIDRIDVNGDYCPENCRWATVKEQARNRRNNKTLTYHGETMPLAAWSERTGIKFSVLWDRLYNFYWSVEEALETPVGERKK